eukprot:3659709-Rhodomonas_salina.2
MSGGGCPRALGLAGVHCSHGVKIECDFRSSLAGVPWGLGVTLLFPEIRECWVRSACVIVLSI